MTEYKDKVNQMRTFKRQTITFWCYECWTIS